MIIGHARVSTTEQNVGLQRDDLRLAFEASVDPTDARSAPRSMMLSASRLSTKSRLPGKLEGGQTDT
jgi:hypothetical protein